MPLKTKPLNNNVLIEVMRDDDGVSRADENESLKYGKIIEVSFSIFHVTASSFGNFSEVYLQYMISKLLPSSIVRWEEFAEGGQTFEEDGKTYALVPWWRLISIEEGEPNDN